MLSYYTYLYIVSGHCQPLKLIGLRSANDYFTKTVVRRFLEIKSRGRPCQCTCSPRTLVPKGWSLPTDGNIDDTDTRGVGPVGRAADGIRDSTYVKSLYGVHCY